MSAIIQAEIADAIMQPWWSAWMAMKWGFADQCCHLWAAVGLITPSQWREAEFKGDIPAPVEAVIVYREFMAEGQAESVLANRIVEMTPVAERPCLKRFYLGSESLNRQKHKATWNGVFNIIGDITSRHGLPRPVAGDENRVDGWRFMYSCLRQAQMTDMEQISLQRVREGPMLLISSACGSVIENVPLATRADRDQNDIELHPEQEWDAVVNCLRYLLKGKPAARPQAPVEVRRDELLCGIEDPMAKHMAMLRFNEKNKQTGRRPTWRTA